MAITVKELLKIAAAQIGYKEKETNAQLDNPTANAGDDNWTKYARDLHAAGYYNGNKNGYAWCDVFVDWCFYQLCGKDAAKAQAVQCQTGPYGAGCYWSLKYYKDQGRYFTANPQPGDQIFFGNVDHTGIVESVTADTITTIEGNASNQVKRITYKRSNSYITGFGRPKYEQEAAEEETPAARPAKSIETVAKEVIDGKWGNGADRKARLTAAGYDPEEVQDKVNELLGAKSEEAEPAEPAQEVCDVKLPVLKKGSEGASVKALQTLLIGYGYSCGSAGVDGDFGSATDAAVRAYQKAKGLTVDGSCGHKTWVILLGA